MARSTIHAFCFSLCFAFASHSATASELSIQPKTGTSWAAVAAMLLEHAHRFDARVCEVETEVLAGQGQKNAACCDPKAKRCAASVPSGDLGRVLRRSFGIRTAPVAKPLGLSETKSYLGQGKALIVVLSGAGKGRPVLVTGAHGEQLIVLDPTRGRRLVPYAQLRKSTAWGLWSRTLVVTTRGGRKASCTRAEERVDGDVRTRIRCSGAAGARIGPQAPNPAIGALCRKRCTKRRAACLARCPQKPSPDKCMARCHRGSLGCFGTCPE